MSNAEGGGGYYLYRTKRVLKKVQGTVSGKNMAEPSEESKPDIKEGKESEK